MSSLRVEATTRLGALRLELAVDVPAGRCLAIVGPSGAGKSSSLRIAAGLLRPEHGRVTCGDEVWLDTERGIDRRPEARRCGYVFQDYALLPHLRAWQDVAFALRDRPRAVRREEAHGWLARFGLEALADARPATLSGGERQRVALARALVGRPAALLLDEPFASLDAALRDRLRAELSSLAERTAVTVIHVTHDRTEALALADRVAVLKEGRLEQVAPPRDLYASPKTPFVASFVSDAALLPVETVGERRFTPQGSNATFEVDAVAAPDGLSREGVLAFRPEDVRLTTGGAGTVRASLFLGDACEVHLEWEGHRLRARAPAETRLGSGERVRPVFSHGVFFPSDQAPE